MTPSGVHRADGRRRARIRPVLAPAALLVGTLFFFGPFTIYCTNLAEFPEPFPTLLAPELLRAGALFLALCAIGAAANERLRSWYVGALLGLGILLWIQGNLLLWDYGNMGKETIQWASYPWRGWVDGSVWIGLLTAVLVFHKRLYPIASLTSAVLLSLQLASALLLSLQEDELWIDRPVPSADISPPPGIFEFSSGLNVIHVILDEFQSTIFQENIDRDPNYYYEILSGFTFFKEATGVFPTTVMSIPAILSETVYRNDVPIEEFIDVTYRGRTIPNLLYEMGYDVDIAAPLGWYARGNVTNWYYIPVPYGRNKHQHTQDRSSLLFELSLFRQLPHPIKRFLATGRGSSSPLQNYDLSRHLAHTLFLQDMIDHMSVNRQKPLYKLIHFLTSHYPAALNESCEHVQQMLPWNWDNIRVQARCSLDHFLLFLKRLKALEVYDSSLIIVQADHGYWNIEDSLGQLDLRNVDETVEKDFGSAERFAKVVASSLPLLVIKPPRANGPLQKSSVQASSTDVAATIGGILQLGGEFTGRSVFDLGPEEVRERSFSYYDKLNRAEDRYFEHFYRFIITGSAFDRRSWALRDGGVPREPIAARPLGEFSQELHVRTPIQSMKASSRTTLLVTVKNPGREIWPATGGADGHNGVNLSYRWIAKNGKDSRATREPLRTPLPRDLAPGEEVSLQAAIEAPQQTGVFVLRLTMVQEAVAWFDDRGAQPLDFEVHVAP